VRVASEQRDSACGIAFKLYHRIPALEKNLADGTLVGGEQRYRFASLAKRGYRSLLLFHQVYGLPVL